MEQNIKEKFRLSIQKRTAKDIIGNDFKLVDIGSQDTILNALQKLQKNNLYSLPVYYENTGKYFGLITLLDLAVVIYILAVSKSFIDLFAEKLIDCKEFDNEDFKIFSKEPVEEFVNASEREQWGTIKIDTPILDVMQILSNPAQSDQNKGMSNIRRVGVVDDEGKVVGLISQYGLMEYLIKEMKESKLFENIKVDQVIPSKKKKIITIKETDHANEGFKVMLENKISSVGVVNDQNQLVSMFSSYDIKREKFGNNLFSDLRLPVKDYLSKSQRYFDKEINEEAFTLSNDDSFMVLCDKIEKYQLHNIFSVDENRVPVNAISLCDIFSALLN